MSRPVGVILAGGQSRRMGTDKSLLRIDGRPMVIAVADALWEARCQPVECQGGDAAALAGVGLDVVADATPGSGPVRAIAEALRRHQAGTVIVACDLPALDAATVRAVIDAGDAAGKVAVAATGERTHLVLYVPAELADRWDPELRSVRDALVAADALAVQVAPAAVANVNHPEDVPAAGPAVGDEPVVSEHMSIQEITVDDLAELLAQGAPLVDVREPDEYAAARVPGARLVPLGSVPDHLDAFSADTTTYVICRSGARSMRACEFAAAHGREVVNVAGGTLAWIESGRPVDSGS
jgi:molybdopterin-guanine dinucleotide biosynthesis protein A/rhodanese-related sulfurtransferase